MLHKLPSKNKTVLTVTTVNNNAAVLSVRWKYEDVD